MQNSRQVIWGIVTALVSLGLILGALLLTVAEGNQPLPTSTVPPTPTLTATIPSIRQSATPLINTATPLLITLTSTPTIPSLTPSLTPTLPPTLPLTLPPTLIPSLTSCPPPQGWLPYTVRAGDTLNGLAARYQRTGVEISTANCLGFNDLETGMVIYLPAVPTRTPVPCGPPKSWVIYIVQQGDTLYRLSRIYGVTVAQLQKANCISGSLIHIGQPFFVPPWGPLFPSLTFDPALETLDTDTPPETPTP